MSDGAGTGIDIPTVCACVFIHCSGSSNTHQLIDIPGWIHVPYSHVRRMWHMCGAVRGDRARQKHDNGKSQYGHDSRTIVVHEHHKPGHPDNTKQWSSEQRQQLAGLSISQQTDQYKCEIDEEQEDPRRISVHLAGVSCWRTCMPIVCSHKLSCSFNEIHVYMLKQSHFIISIERRFELLTKSTNTHTHTPRTLPCYTIARTTSDEETDDSWNEWSTASGKRGRLADRRSVYVRGNNRKLVNFSEAIIPDKLCEHAKVVLEQFRTKRNKCSN